MLRRFYTTISRRASASDPRQVPAAGASVNIYKRGLAMDETITLTPDETNHVISVINTGLIVAGDIFQLGTDSTLRLQVVSVDSVTALTVDNISSDHASLPLARTNRMICTTNKPVLYSDIGGVTELTPQTITLGATGELTFFTQTPAVDFIVTDGGIDTIYYDITAGYSDEAFATVNARDYLTIQGAIDALPAAGGRVVIPAGYYDENTVPAMSALTVGENVVLQGGGINATYLMYTPDVGAAITINGSQARLVDLTVAGPGTGSVADGIVIGNIGGVISSIKLDEVGVDAPPRYGILLIGTETGDANTACIEVTLRNCQIGGGVSPTGACLRFEHGCTTVWVSNGIFSSATGSQLVTCSGTNGVSFRDCVFEPQDITVPLVSTNGDVRMLFDNCWFETHGGNEYCVFVNANALTIRDCFIGRDTGSEPKLATILHGRDIRIDNCFSRVADLPPGNVWLETDIMLDTTTDPYSDVIITGGLKYNAAETLSGPLNYGYTGDIPRRVTAFSSLGRNWQVPRVADGDERLGMTELHPGKLIFVDEQQCMWQYTTQDGGNWLRILTTNFPIHPSSYGVLFATAAEFAALEYSAIDIGSFVMVTDATPMEFYVCLNPHPPTVTWKQITISDPA